MHYSEGDSLNEGPKFRIEENDEAFGMISNGWGDALKQALDGLPGYNILGA